MVFFGEDLFRFCFQLGEFSLCFDGCCFFLGFGTGEDSIGSRLSGSGDKEHAKGGGCCCLLQGMLLLVKVNFES